VNFSFQECGRVKWFNFGLKDFERLCPVFVNRRQADFVFRGDVHKRAVAGDDLCQDVSLYLKRAAKIGGGFRVGYTPPTRLLENSLKVSLKVFGLR
jgi:hypothetical protein